MVIYSFRGCAGGGRCVFFSRRNVGGLTWCLVAGWGSKVEGMDKVKVVRLREIPDLSS